MELTEKQLKELPHSTEIQKFYNWRDNKKINSFNLDRLAYFDYSDELDLHSELEDLK